MGGENVYNGKEEELVLVSLSESYSELDTILVSTTSTLLAHLLLSTDYLNYQLLF